MINSEIKGSPYGVYYIYCIECAVNHKMYIGRTRKPSERAKSHVWALRSNRHKNEIMQNDFNKYGEKEFTFKIIETSEHESGNKNGKEKAWMKHYKTYNPNYGYNYKDPAFRFFKSTGEEVAD